MLAPLLRDRRVQLAGGVAIAVGLVAAIAVAYDKGRPLADRIRKGRLFRANVRNPWFTGSEVCMRATRIEWQGGHVVRIVATFEDQRHSGYAVEVEVSPSDVTAVTPEGAEACAAPMSFRWVEIPADETSVMLRKGLSYRACVDVPAIIPNALVRSKLKPGLEARGFRDVVVEEDPRDMPCDFLVEGVWSRADEVIERPGAVVKAWREG